VIEPGDDLSVVVGFMDSDVGHEPVGCGAVSVLLARFDAGHVAGAHLLGGATSAGDVADAVGDVQRLAAGVGVPGGAGAGGEADVGAADGGLAVGVADAVDVDGAREPVTGAGGGPTSALGELRGRVLSWAEDVRSSVRRASRTVTVAVMSPGNSDRRDVALESRLPRMTMPW